MPRFANPEKPEYHGVCDGTRPANEARASMSLADFGSQVAKKVSGPKEHEPDDAQDQNGKAGGETASKASIDGPGSA